MMSPTCTFPDLSALPPGTTSSTITFVLVLLSARTRPNGFFSVIWINL